MRITAVVCCFWEERTANAGRIVSDLLESTRPPERIIVLDNNPAREVPLRAEVRKSVRANKVTRSMYDDLVAHVAGHNWECRGKYIAGLLDPADYYLLIDDDTSVGSRQVEALERTVTRSPEVYVTGYWGVRLQPASFGMTFSGGAIVGSYSPWLEQVDAFHGRYLFASHTAVVNMLALEAKVRLGFTDRFGAPKWNHGEGDDLLIGLANPGNCYMVPLGSGELPEDLDDGGVAMCAERGYFEMRDEFLNDALAVRDGVHR